MKPSDGTKPCGLRTAQHRALTPVVFVAMSIMMIGIGLLASYVPARRASNVDAIESLRND
jgi:ABC-type antimicrobial peptide transport system permease subunit